MWRGLAVRATGLLAAILLLLVPAVIDLDAEYPANKVYWIIVHHAASGWDPDPAKPQASVDISAALIDKLHRDRGFDEIGYNYVVRFDGAVEKGRAEDLRGAHAKAWDHRGISYNASSIGVCFAGNCDVQRWTLPQQAAGYRLLRELMRRYGVPPERVIGHNETGFDTACPGKLVDMDKVRARLARMAVEED
jgi:N-acetylmuramoyl-L-alanine amidase